MRAGHLSRFVGTIGGALVMVVVSTGTGFAQSETPADPSPTPTALVLRADDLSTRAAVVEVATSDATTATLVVDDDEECVLARASVISNLSGPCSAIPHPTDARLFKGGKLVLALDKGRGALEVGMELKLASGGDTLTITTTRLVKCTAEAKKNRSCKKWQVVDNPAPESLDIETGLEGGELEVDVRARALSLTLQRPGRATATLHKDGYIVLRRSIQVRGTYGKAQVVTGRSTVTLFERVEPAEAKGDEEAAGLRRWGTGLLALYFVIVAVMFWIASSPPTTSTLEARAERVRTTVDIAEAQLPDLDEKERRRRVGVRKSILDLLDAALEMTRGSWLQKLLKGRSRNKAAGLMIEGASRLRIQLASDVEVEVRLRSALAETHKLSVATKKAWASQASALLSNKVNPAYRRAALSQLSAQLEAVDDARTDALAQVQDKTFLLTLTGILATGVLLYNGYGQLLFVGAVGALIGRFLRVMRPGARTDSLSWALVAASPIVGALFAWAGLVLMALLKRMNIVDFAGISELELSTLKNPGVVVYGLAVLFSLSERLLDRVVSRSLAGIFPDAQDSSVDLPEKSPEPTGGGNETAPDKAVLPPGAAGATGDSASTETDAEAKPAETDKATGAPRGPRKRPDKSTRKSSRRGD